MAKKNDTYRITARCSEADADLACYSRAVEMAADVEDLLAFAAEMLPAAPCRCIDGSCFACRAHEVFTRRTGRRAFPTDGVEHEVPANAPF